MTRLRLVSVPLTCVALPVCPAGLRQLKWEAQRDDWIQGRDVKTLRRRKAMMKKRKPFGRGKPFGAKGRKK